MDVIGDFLFQLCKKMADSRNLTSIHFVNKILQCEFRPNYNIEKYQFKNNTIEYNPLYIEGITNLNILMNNFTYINEILNEISLNISRAHYRDPNFSIAKKFFNNKFNNVNLKRCELFDLLSQLNSYIRDGLTENQVNLIVQFITDLSDYYVDHKITFITQIFHDINNLSMVSKQERLNFAKLLLNNKQFLELLYKYQDLFAFNFSIENTLSYPFNK